MLSKSTAREDRGPTFEGYRQLLTLREYLLVEYQRREVHVWRCDDAGSWDVTSYGPGDSVGVESVLCTLPMELIYEDNGL